MRAFKIRENLYVVDDMGIATVFDSRNEFLFICDEDDIEKLSICSWNRDSKNYSQGKVNQKIVKAHRVIMGAIADQKIDHISRDNTDNRKSNLRFYDDSLNNRNRGMLKNNTSGTKGVYWDKYNNKWRAGIGIDSKQVMLGSFDTKEEAIQARLKAEHENGYCVYAIKID